MDTFQQRAEALTLEIAALESDLVTASNPSERNSIQARLASARRSLEWYRARLPRRITTLSVNVAETIHSSDGLA